MIEEFLICYYKTSYLLLFTLFNEIANFIASIVDDGSAMFLPAIS
jgi:hypothetical protein